jgi:hypothetical protein
MDGLGGDCCEKESDRQPKKRESVIKIGLGVNGNNIRKLNVPETAQQNLVEKGKRSEPCLAH